MNKSIATATATILSVILCYISIKWVSNVYLWLPDIGNDFVSIGAVPVAYIIFALGFVALPFALLYLCGVWGYIFVLKLLSLDSENLKRRNIVLLAVPLTMFLGGSNMLNPPNVEQAILDLLIAVSPMFGAFVGANIVLKQELNNQAS
ncbi:hypothetical protein [Thalassotalea agarivorans]|uniref:Uncharacterized protein n=1 Tax=Thalassotalea agarivorans TaxID=349064 RepID=A0A1I0FKF2_THASX|nr:hypothetical protein [Thalassotalea agarivorans]SET58835.1 hypothetical protein SAMN05660429_02180 [Thalassotalea agarivorans]